MQKEKGIVDDDAGGMKEYIDPEDANIILEENDFLIKD